ncbi:uncharacterized protein LOC111640233 [Centruroides sculpturatus]|uniref:uncharacterized protein LOC111640233 n=1 Tax=Centruroides sculpturatus TaxID=218467 RepID=UPI000C6E3677|nr:uncharacterized protein LOC111640233 [Centruroides sculpturatus]
MNNVDALTETSSTSQEISSRVLKIPEILLRIFRYLSDEDLQQCGQVCSSWKDVTKDILYKKIAIFRKKIPISMLNTLADNSEQLRSFVGYSDYFQYLWFYLKPCMICPCMPPHRTEHTIPSGDESFDALTFLKENKNKENVQLSCDVYSLSEDEIEINIAIFPSVPGFNIRHFSFTFNERFIFYTRKMLYVSQLLNIPEEKLKCVIGIKDYGIYFHDNGTGAYTTYTLEEKIRKGIAFYGERVQAVSLCVQSSECDYRNVKEKLERLKRLKPKMVQKRCFAFIFHNMYCDICKCPIFQAFKTVFPFVTSIEYSELPQFEVLNPPENFNFDCVNVGTIFTQVIILFTFVSDYLKRLNSTFLQMITSPENVQSFENIIRPHSRIWLLIEEINEIGKYFFPLMYCYAIYNTSFSIILAIFFDLDPRFKGELLGHFFFILFLSIVVSYGLSRINAQLYGNFYECDILSSSRCSVLYKLKILDFMKRFGRTPIGLSVGELFCIKKNFVIRVISAIYSLLSSLLELATTNDNACNTQITKTGNLSFTD